MASLGDSAAFWATAMSLLFYAMRLVFIATVVHEPIAGKKFRAIGADLIVLGAGAIIGVVTRMALDGKRKDSGSFALLAICLLLASTIYWMLLYAAANPQKEEGRCIRWVASKLSKSDTWVLTASWAVRCVSHLILGLLGYGLQLWLALVWLA